MEAGDSGCSNSGGIMLMAIGSKSRGWPDEEGG